METNFSALTDGPSSYYKTPSGSILSNTLIPLSPAESNELKTSGSIMSKKSILDEIKGIVKSYDLINEKGEKVKINQTVLGIRMGGIETKNGKDYHNFGFTTLGLSANYLSIKGFVEVEIKIVTKYEHLEIDKNDVGDFVNIGGEKATILEFDDNEFHFEMTDGTAKNFDLFFENCDAGNESIAIPQNIYNAFRANQGLNYATFIKKQKELGLQNKANNDNREVWIYTSTDCKIDKIYFYSANKAKTVTKTLKIPVDIKIK
jgi:hypothetical protein